MRDGPCDSSAPLLTSVLCSDACEHVVAAPCLLLRCDLNKGIGKSSGHGKEMTEMSPFWISQQRHSETSLRDLRCLGVLVDVSMCSLRARGRRKANLLRKSAEGHVAATKTHELRPTTFARDVCETQPRFLQKSRSRCVVFPKVPMLQMFFARRSSYFLDCGRHASRKSGKR